MAFNKIGFHGAVPGKFNGWGDYVRALDAAGIPAGIMSVGGGGFGDIEACWNNGSTVPHVAGMRYMPPGGGQDVPPYGTDPRQAAVNWWGWLYPLIGADVKRHKDKVWIVTGNELDKHQADWLGRFYIELATIMHGEGFKLCAFNFAPGEPEPPHWETAGMLDYLKLCASRPQDTAVGLHEYSLANDLQSSYPHLIGRFEALHAACDKHGIKRPNILITEWGWRQDTIPDPAVAMGQIPWAAALYASHINILSAGLWTLKEWQGNVDDRAQGMIPLMKDYTLTARFPDPAPPDPTPPPTNKPKIVIVKKPAIDRMTAQENADISAWAFANYGRTGCHVPSDLESMLRKGDLDTSYAVIPYPDRQADDIVLVESWGYKWQSMSGSPLDGLKLGHLFAYAHQLTSPFDAPRNYGNGKHEGDDWDVIGGPVNNTVQVLCVYDGIIDRSLDSTGNYGKYVRVKHERNGKPFYTRYCHLDTRTAVTIGAAIKKGDPVGEVGTTGVVTGEHVHRNLEVPGFGLSGYVVADVVNPAPYSPTAAEAAALPPVPTGQTYDLVNYLLGKRDGRALQLSTGETEQYQEAGGWIYCIKNSQWEQFRVDGSYIWRAKDTSPGPAPDYAERPGQLRWYWQQETGQNAARWCPRNMTVGQTWAGFGHYTQFYYKTDCARSAANTGNATNKATLIAHHPSKTWGSVTIQDVLEFKGAGEEHFWLARDWGMIGWSAPWGESHVTELFQPGQRNLTRESGCFG